jgi:hypothetical protein
VSNVKNALGPSACVGCGVLGGPFAVLGAKSLPASGTVPIDAALEGQQICDRDAVCLPGNWLGNIRGTATAG